MNLLNKLGIYCRNTASEKLENFQIFLAIHFLYIKLTYCVVFLGKYFIQI